MSASLEMTLDWEVISVSPERTLDWEVISVSPERILDRIELVMTSASPEKSSDQVVMGQVDSEAYLQTSPD